MKLMSFTLLATVPVLSLALPQDTSNDSDGAGDDNNDVIDSLSISVPGTDLSTLLPTASVTAIDPTATATDSDTDDDDLSGISTPFSSLTSVSDSATATPTSTATESGDNDNNNDDDTATATASVTETAGPTSTATDSDGDDDDATAIATATGTSAAAQPTGAAPMACSVPRGVVMAGVVGIVALGVGI